MDSMGVNSPDASAVFDGNDKMWGETMIAGSRAGLFGLACLASLAGGIMPSSAADYPDHPVRWLIGFPPGGPV